MISHMVSSILQHKMAPTSGSEMCFVRVLSVLPVRTKTRLESNDLTQITFILGMQVGEAPATRCRLPSQGATATPLSQPRLPSQGATATPLSQPAG